MDGQRTTTNAVTSAKDRTLVLVSAGMILPAAFLFSAVAALPHVFIMTATGLALSILITKPLKYSDRSLIYSFMTALVLAVLLDMVFPMKQDRFFDMAKLFMANITVPVILYLAVFATFYQSNPYTIGFSSSLSIIALMLCANYQLSGGNDADLPFISSLLDNFKVFYVSVAAINATMILLALNIARKSLHHTFASRFDWRKSVVYAIAVLISVVSATTLFSLTRTYKNEILQAEAFFRKMRLRSPQSNSGAYFDGEVDLRASYGADRNKNKNIVMLRVDAKTPPGYLRGRSYQYYQDARWTPSTDPQKQMHYRLNVDKLAVNAFFKEQFPGETQGKFDIYPTNACVADFLFLPGNAVRVDTVADRIGYTQNGFFKPKTWESDGGYTVRVPRIDQMSAYPQPNISVIDKNYKYLQTPSDLSNVLDGVLREIFHPNASTVSKSTPGDKPLGNEKDEDPIESNQRKRHSRGSKTAMSDIDKIEKVKSYFLNNFKYTLNPKGPKDKTDPVEFFLSRSKRGHCELFASATALLLRREGIPARYVTGLVCFERHPSLQYFVARLGNAHAWVEAYSREEKKWVLVESTPASASEFHTSFGVVDAWSDRLMQLWRKTFAGIRRGYVARSILAFFSSLFGFIFDLLWHPIRGSVAFISLFFLWWVWRRSGRRKRRMAALSPEMAELSAMFANRVKRIQKKSGEPKLSHESLEEWCARIANHVPVEFSERLIDLVRSYNRLRFSGESPAKKDIASLQKQVSSILLDDIVPAER